MGEKTYNRPRIPRGGSVGLAHSVLSVLSVLSVVETIKRRPSVAEKLIFTCHDIEIAVSPFVYRGSAFSAPWKMGNLQGRECLWKRKRPEAAGCPLGEAGGVSRHLSRTPPNRQVDADRGVCATLLPRLGLDRVLLKSAAPYRQVATSRRGGCQIDLLLQSGRLFYVVEIKRRREIGVEIEDEVAAKVAALRAPRDRTVRTALVYDGRLSPQVAARGYFDALIPSEALLGR